MRKTALAVAVCAIAAMPVVANATAPSEEPAKGGETKKAAKGAKKKAITAVARKLGVLLLTLWRTGATYEPLRHANKTQTTAKPQS